MEGTPNQGIDTVPCLSEDVRQEFLPEPKIVLIGLKEKHPGQPLFSAVFLSPFLPLLPWVGSGVSKTRRKGQPAWVGQLLPTRSLLLAGAA